MRAVSRQPLQIGITLNLNSIESATKSPQDLESANTRDIYLNRVFLDPLYFGKYPDETTGKMGFTFPTGYEKDFPIITTQTDFLGINNYSREVIQYDADSLPFNYSSLRPAESTYSEMWEIYQHGLYDLLIRLKRDYPIKAIYITENGTAVADGVDADNRVRDSRRIQYLQDHIAAMHQAIQIGVPVKGYFVWSLMDNFEWNQGYSRRFGIIYIDYENNQKRIIKDSARWFSQIIRQNGFKLKTYYAEPF